MKSFRSFTEATDPLHKINAFLQKKKDREARGEKLRRERDQKLDAEKQASRKSEAKDNFDLNDLNNADYKPGEDKFAKRKAIKRRRADQEHESVEHDEESINEVLNVAQRRKRGIIARRNKAKLKLGRKKASRRIADKDRLNNRAKRQAKSDLVKKLTKGVSKADLSPQRKAEIEKRLKKMSGRVARGQRRILPSVRKRDRGM